MCILSLPTSSPKEYELPDLIQYFYGVMYRSCRMVAPHPVIFNAIAYLLEQSPFIPYLTRDVLRRVWLHISCFILAGLHFFTLTRADIKPSSFFFVSYFSSSSSIFSFSLPSSIFSSFSLSSLPSSPLSLPSSTSTATLLRHSDS